ncbi:MAG: hypothetical protein HYX69_13210 [Planctomycetia bacterium]|nr:hypothetical protein [Planctomycetia bacterium]
MSHGPLLVVVTSVAVAAASCARPFPHPGPGKSDIRILTATTFLCDNQKCELLGVAEADDPATRARALEFTKAWLDSIGSYVGVYNSKDPLRLPDGTCIVWLRGYDMYLSCLNVELVRAGLVKVDDERWKEYRFTEPTKEGREVADWRGELRRAAQAHKSGDKPRVLFDWPPFVVSNE